MNGELPCNAKLSAFERNVLRSGTLNSNMLSLFSGFQPSAHPMAMLSSIVNALGTYYSQYATNVRKRDLENFDTASTLLMSKVRSIAALSYRMKMGLPLDVESDSSKSYTEDFLSMLFSNPEFEYEDTCGAAKSPRSILPAACRS